MSFLRIRLEPASFQGIYALNIPLQAWVATGLFGYEYLRLMSKRALKAYVGSVPKKELEKQLMDLYQRFPSVKKYYDFVFNPKEEQLILEAKAKIRNEYFPVKRKRPRARRSVAQRYLREFRRLEMDPNWVLDLMLFNLETAQAFSADHKVQEAFYRSMLNSFTEMTHYASLHRLVPEFQPRILRVYRSVQEQQWSFQPDFARALEDLE